MDYFTGKITLQQRLRQHECQVYPLFGSCLALRDEAKDGVYQVKPLDLSYAPGECLSVFSTPTVGCLPHETVNVSPENSTVPQDTASLPGILNSASKCGQQANQSETTTRLNKKLNQSNRIQCHQENYQSQRPLHCEHNTIHTNQSTRYTNMNQVQSCDQKINQLNPTLQRAHELAPLDLTVQNEKTNKSDQPLQTIQQSNQSNLTLTGDTRSMKSCTELIETVDQPLNHKCDNKNKNRGLSRKRPLLKARKRIDNYNNFPDVDVRDFMDQTTTEEIRYCMNDENYHHDSQRLPTNALHQHEANMCNESSQYIATDTTMNVFNSNLTCTENPESQLLPQRNRQDYTFMTTSDTASSVYCSVVDESLENPLVIDLSPPPATTHTVSTQSAMSGFATHDISNFTSSWNNRSCSPTEDIQRDPFTYANVLYESTPAVSSSGSQIVPFVKQIEQESQISARKCNACGLSESTLPIVGTSSVSEESRMHDLQDNMRKTLFSVTSQKQHTCARICHGHDVSPMHYVTLPDRDLRGSTNTDIQTVLDTVGQRSSDIQRSSSNAVQISSDNGIHLIENTMLQNSPDIVFQRSHDIENHRSSHVISQSEADFERQITHNADLHTSQDNGPTSSEVGHSSDAQKTINGKSKTTLVCRRRPHPMRWRVSVSKTAGFHANCTNCRACRRIFAKLSVPPVEDHPMFV